MRSTVGKVEGSDRREKGEGLWDPDRAVTRHGFTGRRRHPAPPPDGNAILAVAYSPSPLPVPL